MSWKHRITRYAEVPTAQLVPHDRNWRVHSHLQRDALLGVLEEIGLIQNILVSERSGKILDGHLRAVLAREAGEPSLPVTYVDVEAAEEATILATLDPLSTLAEASAPALAALLQDVTSGSSAVQQLLSDLAERHQLWPDAWLAGDDQAPETFETADEERYDYRCPKCQHTWSGRAK